SSRPRARPAPASVASDLSSSSPLDPRGDQHVRHFQAEGHHEQPEVPERVPARVLAPRPYPAVTHRPRRHPEYQPDHAHPQRRLEAPPHPHPFHPYHPRTPHPRPPPTHPHRPTSGPTCPFQGCQARPEGPRCPPHFLPPAPTTCSRA